MMRLANGIVLDKDTTFGELKFSALRREVRIQNEDGSVSDHLHTAGRLSSSRFKIARTAKGGNRHIWETASSLFGA